MAERRATPPNDDDLVERLRDAGLRKTVPRVAVLRHMTNVARPVTHAEVVAALADLDRVSIYRVLVDLSRAKILSRSDAGDHVWRFELMKGDRSHYLEHPHFVCVSCGAVACLEGTALRLGSGGAPRAVKAKRVEVQLKGECDACATP